MVNCEVTCRSGLCEVVPGFKEFLVSSQTFFLFFELIVMWGYSVVSGPLASNPGGTRRVQTEILVLLFSGWTSGCWMGPALSSSPFLEEGSIYSCDLWLFTY